MERNWKNVRNNGNGGMPDDKEYKIRTPNPRDEVMLTIEKDIPIPKSRKNREISPYKLILLELEKGDSVVIPHKIARVVRNQLMYMRRTNPESKFVTRKLEPQSLSFRVWRIQ